MVPVVNMAVLNCVVHVPRRRVRDKGGACGKGVPACGLSKGETAATSAARAARARAKPAFVQQRPRVCLPVGVPLHCALAILDIHISHLALV